MTLQVKGFHSKEAVGAVFKGIVILEGKRTPFGKFMGSLSSVSPTDLGIFASKAVIRAAGIDPGEIDQIIVSNIGQASADSFFIARHIGLYSGAPLQAPAVMAQRICGSGIEIIAQAAEQIAMEKSNLILSCGSDCMSRYPLVSFGARQGFPLGRPEYLDMLWDALNDTAAVPMGVTADNLAERFSTSREEIDQFAFQSQTRYQKARLENFFSGEIEPIEGGIFEREGLAARKFRLNKIKSLEQDEHPREATLEKLGQLPFVFSTKGPTTAGSSSGIVDGAASVLVSSEDFASTNGIKPIGRVLAHASVGVEPAIMGIGPVPAVRAVLKSLNMTLEDVDLFEINEAFGAQCLTVAKELKIDLEKLNPNGGAIAIGHPLGATGLRLVTTLLKSLKARGKTIGVASACIGGGQGIAMVVEAL
ncbi:MAG: thiolase family protein [Deltaproteobacteria bacterium]|nr:thiolase family protein [Deltaproteobacteria bacterium]